MKGKNPMDKPSIKKTDMYVCFGFRRRNPLKN
jgi:hypothetical protein